jgi:hypothetical protein
MKTFFLATLFALSIAESYTAAQDNPRPSTPKASAPIDLTGYWVAIVSEDWRFRMVTPKKGDFQSVPMTAEAGRVAMGWDPAVDEAAGNQCKAYGAGAMMRAASRFHITWQDENTLKIDSDYGMQSRMLHFGRLPTSLGERSWQGYSTAQWQGTEALKVTTTNVRAGYLRKNGVPYSENAFVTEYFNLAPGPGGGQVMLVTTIVEDPLYLNQPFIVSSQFKKEVDGSKWDPTPCTAR